MSIERLNPNIVKEPGLRRVLQRQLLNNDYIAAKLSEILAAKTAFTLQFQAAGSLSTGDKAPWSPPMRAGGSITAVSAVVKTASTSGAITIDVLKSTDNGANWTTIFSTKITIDQDERSTATAATPAVLNVTTYNADDLFRINIDGAGTGAADLSVGLHCKESLF